MSAKPAEPKVRASDQRLSAKLGALFAISILASIPIWLWVGMPPFGENFDANAAYLSMALAAVTTGFGFASVAVRIIEVSRLHRRRRADLKVGSSNPTRGAIWNLRVS